MLDRIADRWTVLVLLRLRDGAVRFNLLQRLIGGISQKMLSQTLVSLERDGLVKRTASATRPVTVEYEITSLALGLIDCIDKLRAWAETNVGQIEAANVTYGDRNASSKA